MIDTKRDHGNSGLRSCGDVIPYIVFSPECLEDYFTHYSKGKMMQSHVS